MRSADISQVVKHAASSTRMFAKVSIALGKGEELKELPSEATTDFPVTAGGAQEMIIEAVDILRGFLSGVSEDTNLELTFDKPFGPMNCLQFAALQVGHVAQHARQIADIKKNEGFPATA